MFKCERCGSSYNGNYVGVENCPRCLLRERVQSPLSFKMFKITGTAEGSGKAQPDEDQRVRSAR